MHYKRDKTKIFVEEQYERKCAELRDWMKEEYNSLRFIKAISKAVQIIAKKDKKLLSYKDYQQISLECYKTTNKYRVEKVKKMLNMPVVREKINTQLVELYSKAGLSKDEIPELLIKVKEYAEEKKDGNLILRLVEKIEKANDLTGSANVPQNQTNIQANFNQYREEPKETSEGVKNEEN